MSDFKLGDLVKRIAGPEHDYRYMKSGEIYTVTGLPTDDCEYINVNGFTDCLNVDYFELYKPRQVIVGTEPTEDLQSELEEALAKIESLESALEDAVRELISLRSGNNTAVIDVNNNGFKPISKMTLEDWVLAKSEGWMFADNKGGNPLFVENVINGLIDFDKYSFPFTVDGVHTREPEEYQIIKRIK